MLLAIDAGNTNIVFSVFSGPELAGNWRAATRTDRTADEYAAFLLSMFVAKGVNPDKIQVAIISSVVPNANFALRRLCESNLGVQAWFIGDPELDLGMRIKLDRPEELGSDRAVNAVAALATTKPPFLIVDFGTATTIDYIDAEGDYAGGVIAPGVNLSLQSLHGSAAKLPQVSVAAPQRAAGRNTTEAMQSGIFYGYIALVEGLVQRLRQETGHPDMPVIVTGGLASLFVPATSIFSQHDPNLTLRGLKIVFDRNRDKVLPNE